MIKIRKTIAIASVILLATILIALACCLDSRDVDEGTAGITNASIVVLPAPDYQGDVSVEEAIQKRRSIRTYAEGNLTLDEISQLLWAAQGITGLYGGRAAPSAGATYPLETYLIVGEVENLRSGVYKYVPSDHALVKKIDGDKRRILAEAASNQIWAADGAVMIVFTADYERTTSRYGERGIRYVHMEVGHAAENVYLEAAALDLGTVVIGAFNDEQVKTILNLEDETPLYIMPVGRT